MKKNRKGLIIIAAIAVVLIIVFVLKISSGGAAGRGNPKPVVVAGKLTEGEIENREVLTGDILPEQQANIFTKVNGNIEKIFVDIGSKVSTNQVLAIIDTTIYTQNVKQAKASLMQAEANHQNAKLTFERNKKLLEQKMISQQDLDNSKASYDITIAQKQAAEAVYNNAVTQLSYCRITAPFSGIITKRMYDQGSYVSSSAGSQSSVLFTLAKADKLKMVVNMPERSVPNISKIQNIIITADALPGKRYTGKITKSSQSVDIATRTMAVEVEIINPDKELKPGMFATVIFVTDKKAGAQIVPLQVVLNDEDGNFVYLINQDTTVSKKYVTTGIKMDNNIEITAGITKEDRIVFVGQTLIKDKMKVKISK